MAKSTKTKAERQNLADSDDIVCRIFYAMMSVQQEGSSTAPHEHPFWQVDFHLDATVQVESDSGTVDIKKKNFLVIAPNIRHRIFYPKRTRCLSLKLEASGLARLGQVDFIESSREVRGIARAMLAMFPESDEKLKAKLKPTMEHLLCALLCMGYGSSDEVDESTGLERKIREYVKLHSDRALTVGEVARAVSYSESHVSAAFREASGTALKNHIDEARAGRVAELLAYSEMTVSEIADKTGFTDVFALSRFFRRVRGCSPRNFRREVMSGRRQKMFGNRVG